MDETLPGTVIETMQQELGYSTKELAEQLGISEVWVYQLTRHQSLPSFHLLTTLLRLYLKNATLATRAHRQHTSRDLLRRCSDRYIQQHLQRIAIRAHDIFQHESLLALTNSAT